MSVTSSLRTCEARLPSPLKRWGTFQGKERIMKTIINLLKDESGAAAAEYALILAIVGTAIAFAAILLGDTIANAMNEASLCISSNGSTCN